MSFTSIIVTGHWIDAAGNGRTGSVAFRLTGAMQDSTNHEIVDPSDVVVQLETGAISQHLIANNDSTTAPPTRQYVVTEEIDGSFRPPYLITVPFDAAGGTIDISALAPAA